MNRIRDFFTFRSIRYKLMAASIACILLPAALTMTIYNYLTQGAVQGQAATHAQESLMLVNGSVTNLLKTMVNIANYVQTNAEMDTYFKLLVTGQVDNRDPYQQLMETKRITDLLDNFTVVGEKCYVTVLLTNGSYFTNYDIVDYNPLNIKKEPWFENMPVLNGLQSYWTDPVPTVFSSMKANNPYQISLVRALREYQGLQLYGYIVVTVMENQVNHIFRDPIEHERIMIVDASNRIVSSPEVSDIGHKVSYLDSAQTEMQSAIMPINGVNQLVTQAPLQFAGWRLVSMQPYKDATANISSIFTNVFALQLVSFIVFLLLLLYLLRRFTHPLVRLGKVASTVQRGNLDVRSGVGGQDEIGRLGYSFDQMLDKVKEMIAEVSLTQARKRKAELAMLQAQINPHFLFNVLNSVRMKVMHRGDQESAEMIGSLSKLLRMTISADKGDIPLHEEIELVADYLQLMNMRQRDKVELDVDVAAEALLLKVPRFCLQPVIENALIHGLNKCAGTIRIKAWTLGERLQLAVEDDGVGMSERELDALRAKLERFGQGDAGGEDTSGHFSGIGLPNVFERMKMTFGEEFRMDIDSGPGEGTRIQMSIPRKEVGPDV
jgi:two-component system sensor histidine kinase YesM